MGVSDHKCLACNAKLKFEPKSQKWICEYCGTEYTLKDFEDEKGNKKNTKTSKVTNNNGYLEYHCPDCGAQIVMDENTAATECVYCGNTAIITERFEGKFEPKRVIPFKTTKEEAIEAFSSYKKGKVFMPKDFLNKNNIEKVSGVYIPFFLYDMIVDGSLDVEAIKEQRWSEGDFKYVKKDYYNVIREGNMIFEKIPTDASKKFSDDIMDSIEPFDYNDLTTFNSSYMSGFLAEKYDLNADDLLSRAEGRAKQTTQDILFADINGYNSKKIDEFNGRVSMNGNPEYVMLPVWMMNVKYEDKIYTMAMNGQTGKFIGNVPVSKGKVAATWVGLTTVIAIIIAIIGMCI